MIIRTPQKNNLKSSVEELNSEFDKVKNLLEKYLYEKIEDEYFFSEKNLENYLQIFEKNYYKWDEINSFVQESRINYEQQYSGIPLKIDTCFLSFNYTSTIKEYMKIRNLLNFKSIEIHGSLNDKENPINFGFGDEMDEDYKIIENINDNEYLKNIISFQYLHTSNYKRLLDLVDSEKFQIYIMGHSCGLSDRTLLNTIFEHENCRSIKIF